MIVAGAATRLRNAINDAAARLAVAGIDSARFDAEELAAHAAGIDRGRLALVDIPIGGPYDDFSARYRALIAARAQRIPLQHLIGSVAFGPVVLQVGPGVFTPRPETESLLEWACAQVLPSNPTIVDLCTGTGALAVALAAHVPRARILAVDDSAAALDYAGRNVLGTAVEAICADVTTAGLLGELDDQVDLIVANPPYIPDGATLDPEVAEHDPHHALFAGPDGMTVIHAIVALAGRWLRPGALIAVEHDDTTSSATIDQFERLGVFHAVTAHEDLAGRPRFVTARRNVSRQRS